MDDEKKQQLRMTAHMDGQAAIARRIGPPVKVSAMELIALANLAELGVLTLFSKLDGEEGEMAAKELEDHIKAIRAAFGGEGVDGLNRLTTTAVAMLRGERIGKYLVA
jgi:hypothetical protein